MPEDVADPQPELVTFTTSKEAYVYAPLPAVTSYGHRAELWNPDKWLQEVKIKVVTSGDHAFVRLLDNEKGELFAECPLPHDGTPLTTAVEPVVDSSRYFVIKVVDRGSRKHAFIGIGFRERMDASDFSAALDDYRQYLRRKQEAEHMRQEFEKLVADDQQPGTGDGATAAAADLSLKPGQTIRLNLSPSLKRTGSGKSSSSSMQQVDSLQQPQQQVSPGSLKLPPPPGRSHSGTATFFKLHAPPAAAAAAADGEGGTRLSGPSTISMPDVTSSSSDNVGRQAVQPASQAGSVQAAALPHTGAGAGGGAGPAVHVDDDWGEFVS